MVILHCSVIILKIKLNTLFSCDNCIRKHYNPISYCLTITVTSLLGVREDLQDPTSQLLSVRNNIDLFNLIAYHNSY